MTSNLPNSTIINRFLSDDEEIKLSVQIMVEEFLISKGLMIHDDFTLSELSTASFGSKYPDNYQRTRYFVMKLRDELQTQNKSMVEAGLAFIFNEGQEVKIDCEKMGRSYRAGGAYQFTPKMLGLLLLAKNDEFREWVRMRYDEEGNKLYVPYNLEKKKTNLRKYVIAHTD